MLLMEVHTKLASWGTLLLPFSDIKMKHWHPPPPGKQRGGKGKFLHHTFFCMKRVHLLVGAPTRGVMKWKMSFY